MPSSAERSPIFTRKFCSGKEWSRIFYLFQFRNGEKKKNKENYDNEKAFVGVNNHDISYSSKNWNTLVKITREKVGKI